MSIVKHNKKFLGVEESSHNSNDSQFNSQEIKSSGIFNLSSRAGKRFHMFQMIFLPFIPILALIIQNSTSLTKVVYSLKEVTSVWEQVELTMEVGRVIQELQRERVEVAYSIFTNTTRSGSEDFFNSLHKKFKKTDDLLKNMTYWLQQNHYASGKLNLNKHMLELKSKREKIINLSSSKTLESDDEALDEMTWYNVANDLILDQLNARIRETTTSGVWKILIAFKNTIRSIENYSISMVYGLYYFGKGHLSSGSFVKYITYDSLAEEYINATMQFSQDIMYEFTTFQKQFGSTRMLANRRKEIYKNLKIDPNSLAATDYFKKMLEFIDELRRYQHKLRDFINIQVAEEMMKARIQQGISALLLAMVLLISPIIIYRLRRVIKQSHEYSTHIILKTVALRKEKKKSDRLLCQMLPVSVVKELRQRRQVPAEHFDSVTIYFSDIVQFTRLSSLSSPMQIVVMLNTLYSLFDTVIEHYDVYKVETIGDAYMVVSGLPNKNDDHAGEICTMALDIVEGLKYYEIPHRPDEKLEIRIGVNTGSCVAGVVGTKMPRYCLFGDSINTASRLESAGESMMIHIASYTKVELDRIGGFLTKERGEIELKGKGRMITYWLFGKEGGIPQRDDQKVSGFLKSEGLPEYIKEIFSGDSD